MANKQQSQQTQHNSATATHSARAPQARDDARPQRMRGRTQSRAPGAPWYIADTAAKSGDEKLPKALQGKGFKPIIDSETGEILVAKRGHDCTDQLIETPSQKRARRWARKAAVAEILGKKHRVACCHRNHVKNAKGIDVWAKLGAYTPGHYKGLQTCALPWLCSICQPKIGERRSGEIQSAMTQCLAEGGQVLMPTFTFSHGRHDPLSNTLDLMKSAMRWVSSHRRYKELKKKLKVVGRIIATEITHSEANGWHPHLHELWFFEKAGIDVAALEDELFDLWLQACVKYGLGTPSRRRGVVVQDGQHAARYVSKMGQKQWTLADELAKSNAKNGRGQSRSFWQIIDCYMDDSADDKHRARARQLIVEYEQATKDKKALTWTPGLKKRYAIAELDDEELAAKEEENAVFIAQIPLDDWKIVLKHRLEAVILDVCLNGKEAIFAVIEAYRRRC